MLPTSKQVSSKNPFLATANRTDGQSTSPYLVPQHAQSMGLQLGPSRPATLRATTNPSSRVASPAPALQHMPNSYPLPGETHNYNNGDGMFNQVNGDQLLDYSTAYNGHIYEGDTFEGPIHGGNVGGRNNQNAIYNGAVTVDTPKRYGGVDNSRQEMRGLEAKADYFQSEIDRLMNEMGLDEEQKLERKVSDLQLTFRALQREVDNMRPTS